MTEPAALISVYDAARLIGCSCQLVRRLIARGVLGGVAMPGGRKLWLERGQVEAYLALLRKTAAERRKGNEDKATLYQMWLDL